MKGTVHMTLQAILKKCDIALSTQFSTLSANLTLDFKFHLIMISLWAHF